MFTPGALTVDLRRIQELRGRINRWGNTGRVWKRLTEPTNQMTNNADSKGVLVRCHDWGEWAAFWDAVQFIRDWTPDQDLRSKLVAWEFPELVGAQREVDIPSPSRTRLWYSGAATPDFGGCVKLANRHFVRKFLADLCLRAFPAIAIRRV